ncbi:MAG: isopeptide-forming domain-containing fimbrial protein, partial [Anaerolineae bacterium]|nr:isopeptide-forming domain-containing fimbrial protein [Anaerolineae bacterium]
LNADDEDGVEFEHFIGTAALPSAVMILGETASLTVTTAVPVSQTGYLNAWLDFNGDGDWIDPGEQIATNQSPSGGQVVLNSIAVPASVTTYTTYVRFRFSTEPDLTPAGAAQDGEVEDYQVQFVDPPQKQLIATSESHTGGSNLAIGEIARYRLTVPVPQGTLTNFTITDTLPAGLQFLDDGTATVVFSATTSLTSDPLVISGGPFSSGTDPVFALGTVVNNDTDVADEAYVNLEFNALVTNTSGNQNNTTLDNRFTVTYDSFRATSAPVTVTVVEPAITNLNKTVTVTPDDAGDPAGYQLTFSNSGATTAFNVVLTDTLDLTYLELVPGSVALTPAGGASGLSDLSAGNTLTVTVDTLPVGGSVTVAYSATVTSAAIPGNTIPNTATLIYTSLPLTGTAANPTGSLPPGGSGDPDGERDGSGGVNDYSDSDTAGVTIALPVPVKTLVSTSEGHTGFVAGRENLAIGEIARFRLVAELPEGSAPLLQFRDLVPSNLRFLNDNTATVAFVANGAGITSTALISGTLGCDGGANPTLHFSGSSAAGVTPECTLPNSAVGSNSTNGSDQDLYISGTDVYFKLGSVVNHDDDADPEFVIVEFNAMATDIAANQAGTTFDNRFEVRIDNDADNSSEQVAQSGTVPLRIAEPALSLTKLLNTAPVDAGDTISYTITLQNIASGNGAADAFDLVLTDTLDSNLTLIGWNIAAPGGRTVTDTTSAPTLAVAVDQLAPGESVSVVLTATVSASAPAGQMIPNTGYLLYTSLPGPQGTTANPTGSTTPGAPGDTEGERDGSDGSGGSPNDYAAQADAPLLIEGSAPAKQLVGTSAAHTTGTDVTIGEVLTYSLAVAVPEGIISSLAVTDTLPAGLAYNGHIAFDTGSFNGTFSPGDPTVSSSGGSGDEVVIRYSSPITVPADNIAGNNGFTITLQAVVTDVVGNVGVPPQTALPNTATIHLGGATPVTSPPITATVVEPKVVITKSIVPAAVAAGDFITVSLTVRNAGLSDAFEVVVEDPLPTALFIALSEGSTPAGFSYSTVPAGANTIVRYTGGNLAVNETVTFTFRAQLTTPVSKDLVHTNVATVTQATTLPGSDPNERDEPDVSDDDTVTLIALSLGNRVWFDANNNGLLDGGESGIDGVRLNLLSGAGTPITDTLTSLPITTTTGGGGFYGFTDLVAGDYIVEIDLANFGPGQPLAGYFSSTGATDPDGDLDSDDNGLDDNSPAVNGLRSLPVTLTYSGETLGNEDGDSDPNSNLTVDFGLFSADYGDLPDSYDTTDSAGGAFHTLSAGLYLGSRVDVELDGQPSPTATGDDSAAGPGLPTAGDDEDGITFDTPLIPGQVATLTVQAVGSATFSGSLDFDGSGAFAPGERIFTNTAVLSGTTALGFNVPAGAVPGSTGVRLRYSSDSLTS